MQNPLHVSCKEYAGTPIEAPLDGSPVGVGTPIIFTCALLFNHKARDEILVQFASARGLVANVPYLRGPSFESLVGDGID
jgi:hypothetical protein